MDGGIDASLTVGAHVGGIRQARRVASVEDDVKIWQLRNGERAGTVANAQQFMTIVA